MSLWAALLDVVILLIAAFLLGALCERLRQSAILGYLLAGTLLGPNALDWMPSHEAVATIAELGAALLLFTIGLEFSWRRLARIGPIAFGGGSLQVVVTCIVAAAGGMAMGLDVPAAFAVGSMVALSSTACVLRLLASRAELDSIYGRQALGILLLQDIAVVPLVLLVTVLGKGGTAAELGWHAGKALAAALLLAGAMHLLLKYVMPVVLTTAEAARNRELPILLAVATALGAAWAAHYLGLSPVLGSFLAGMLLAESPFSVQIRADVSSLRTLFVTLFLSSIGMFADPAWVLDHLLLVALAVALIVSCKAAIVFAVARLFGSAVGHAAALAVCLAQVGEFSFVLAGLAFEGALISEHWFKLMMSATIGTLFLTPYLIRLAPHLIVAAGRLPASKRVRLATATPREESEALSDHILLVGFGPAGRRVAETLMSRYAPRLVVVELNSKTADIARGYGLRTYIGDATRTEVLEHLHVQAAAAVIITIPDPGAARDLIEHVRAVSARMPIFARARYHVCRWELFLAGAEVVVDEEDEVGLRIALSVHQKLRAPRPAPPAAGSSPPPAK
jgi:CPA2 family monovalent cation:H+ antiporter-2